MTAVSPLAGNTDLVSFTITASGNKIPDTYQIKQVQVHKEVNRISFARIVIYDGDPSTEAFQISASSTFVPGVPITITAGYHSQETTIFSGMVVKHAIKVAELSKSYLVLTCYDMAIKLTLGRKSAYAGKSDSDAMQKIISAAGLSADVSSTSALHDELVRYYATDWDFLVCRAEVNGQIVLVDDGKVTVQAPQVSASPQLLIEYGDALHELNAEIDARYQLPSVKCSSWDFATQTVVSGSSSEPSVNPQGNFNGKTLSEVLGLESFDLQTVGDVNAAELKVWADAQLLKSRMAKIRGVVNFRGNASPKPGQVVQLAGVGARFNGNAFVSAINHHIENGSWMTEVTFGLSPQWFVAEVPDVVAPLSSGLRPGIKGLQIGTVKQIDQDPDGQTRLLVVAPMIAAAGDGIWARFATPYATKDAGIFFIPEIGDEVLLGFLNDDPNYPVVLGSMYSASSHKPPYEADAPNTYKAIVSNSKLKISIDDVKKILQIETPGGHVITMSDDAKSITITDSNSNKMSFSESGIDISSAKDVTISATGNVSIEAKGGSMSLKAATSLSESAMSISTSADTELSMQGNASAKLSSSGMLTVQGSMVMIN
ncbi:MAG: type VI secretion system tip protein VgrG [Burkholderiales bacterium]|nr:type VI secretion system tip protein VgrG [Burkholderiales bacterium]